MKSKQMSELRSLITDQVVKEYQEVWNYKILDVAISDNQQILEYSVLREDQEMLLFAKCDNQYMYLRMTEYEDIDDVVCEEQILIGVFLQKMINKKLHN